MTSRDMCVHYTGIIGGDILDKAALAERRCVAGVRYADVSEPGIGHGTRFPCVDSQRGTIVCSLHRYPTTEELDESERKFREFHHRFERVMSGELMECLHCGAAVQQWQEVSPCVYAEPCGHRQYQGRALRKANPA